MKLTALTPCDLIEAKVDRVGMAPSARDHNTAHNVLVGELPLESR
jgi:hypothetical protein